MHVLHLGPLAALEPRAVGSAPSAVPRSGSEAVARTAFAVAFTAALSALDAGADTAAGTGAAAPPAPFGAGIGSILTAGALPPLGPAHGLIAQAPPVTPGVMLAPAAATAPAGYPNLTGDLDASPELLARLDRLAAARGEQWTVTSGLRTDAEQARLYANRASNPYPVAAPGTSVHRTGDAADVTIGGRAIQDVVPAGELRAAGLEPLLGDAVHVQLPGPRR
ncbi:MAG TPA: M15 family metallopeptidase [Solirubrobacteraceae bacterium]|nr:M15 family metallopeptidase [Solirubrobacteraceae bacterium]